MADGRDMEAMNEDEPAGTAEDGRAAHVARVDESLGRIRRSMARRSLGRRVLTDLGAGVDAAVMEVVEAIARGGDESDVAVGTVAGLVGVDPSQASRLVASAVKSGLVARVASQEDGRRSALRLTESGQTLLREARQHKRALLGAHFAAWSDEDLADFARLLERFATIARRDDAG